MYNGQGGTASVGSARALQVGSSQARAVEAQRDSNIAREITDGKKIGVELHDIIDRLAQRVEPVRMPAPATVVGGDTPGNPPACTDLAREVQGLNGTVAEGVRRLSILLDSIDL